MAKLLVATESAPPGNVLGIQVLRAFAAIAVVIHHSIRAYTINLPDRLAAIPKSVLDIPWFYSALAAGVDVFFVISGFIMVLVAGPYLAKRKPVADFWLKRALRIYPPYIVATLLCLAFVFNDARHHGSRFDLSPHRILSGLTLFPTFDANGTVQPILGVGWTLSYEVYFYALFGLAILVGGRRYLLVLATMIVAVLLAAQLLPNTYAVEVFLKNSVVLEFLLGCGLGYLYTRSTAFNLPALVLPVAVALFFAASYAIKQYNVGDQWRFLYYGIPAALVVGSVLRLELLGSVRWPELLVFLGGASYSIYLVHVIVIYFVVPRPVASMLLHGLGSADVAIAACVVASIAAGVGYYLLVEKNLRIATLLRQRPPAQPKRTA